VEEDNPYLYLAEVRVKLHVCLLLVELCPYLHVFFVSADRGGGVYKN
jgi:hypothetical protein